MRTSTYRRELVESLLKQQGIEIDADRIPRSDRTRPADLSFAQERIWFLAQMEPDTAAYNMVAAVRLRRSLNVPAVARALNQIIARHEILRTSFITTDGHARQVPFDNLVISPTIFDFSALDRTQREAEMKRLITAEAERPFQLDRPPLLRVSLFRLAVDEHVLLLTMHHIIGDGWSFGVLFREFGALYPAYAAGKAMVLRELQIQYIDFALWQRQRLTGELLKDQIAYWRTRLGGKLPVLDLPSDHPRPPIQTIHGDHFVTVVSSSLLNDLTTLSRREGVTLFMVLLAAFQTLLARYSGQDDILVGTPIAGRSRPELESLIGLFFNVIVLRTDLSGNPSFRELLGRIRENALEAYGHQDLPFGKLVAELQPERKLSHPPIFQAMFVLQNTPIPEIDLGNLKLSPVPIDSSVSKVDLTLEAIPSGNGLELAFEFNTDIFDLARVKRMQASFQVILERMVRDPDERIANFCLLDKPEQAQVLQGWNNTAAAFPSGSCVHELLAAQADATPESTAAVFGSQSITYAELQRRSNQLANFLRSKGVMRDTLVGVYVERSLEMLVGVLGILNAGGAYVPLDPAYPRDRVSFMIEDSGMKLVLTQELLAASLPRNVEPICMDRDWKTIATQPSSSASTDVTPENLAYVIYTSGSTGRPKGVAIPHRAVVNFLSSMRREPGLTHHDVLLAVTTLSFDIAGLELYLPLLVGARVVIATRKTAIDPAALASLIAASGATVMQATPATWRLLIDGGWRVSPQLKVLCGGEPLTRELADQLLACCASVWNMYGPTETTIWSTVHQVHPGKAPIVIGRPIANTQVYLLDAQLNPVPVGVPGELHIGGDGLARGYWQRAELTFEKFIPDPFSTAPGARLYKTGDLARYLPNGTIDCLGRIDHQVKLRGFRIELGEIEANLREHSGVRECVVVAREDVPGDKRLVGYYIARSARKPSASDLRVHLERQLPAYMVPAHFMALPAFPLTPNGKIDRKQLPVPDHVQMRPRVSYAAPRNEVESKIVAIWREILRVDSIDREDNFFDLGGHSLMLVQSQSAIRKNFAAEISIVDLFRFPTVKMLAEYLRQDSVASVLPKAAEDRAAMRRQAIARNRQLRAER